MPTCRLAQVLLPVSAAYDSAILRCSRLCAPAMHLCAQVKATRLLGMSSRIIHICTMHVDHLQRQWDLIIFPSAVLLPNVSEMTMKKLPCQSN